MLFRSTVLSRLNAFLDSEMEQILCFDTAIDAEKFCNEKSAIFIVLPEEDPHHQGMGKSCTADRSAHIPVRRSSGSTAVLWSFPLLQSSRHKQVPVPIRPSPFLTGQFTSVRHDLKNTHKAFWLCGCLVDIWILFFSFSDVCQTSGYCGSLFSASSPASSAMRTRSLPSL